MRVAFALRFQRQEQMAVAASAVAGAGKTSQRMPIGSRIARLFQQFPFGRGERVFALFDVSSHRGQRNAFHGVFRLPETKESSVSGSSHNQGEIGWKNIGFAGDVQPRGYTDEEVSQRD